MYRVSKTEHCRMKPRTTSSFWDIYKIYVVNIIYYLMAATFLKFAYKQGLMEKTSDCAPYSHLCIICDVSLRHRPLEDQETFLSYHL